MLNARKLKIGVITSSNPLANYIKSVRGEFSHSFYISNKGLDEAIPVGQRMQHDGINVILSHKGTSNLLREDLQIPVLSVPYSSLDVITCLSEAAALGKKIFLPSFREKMSGIEIMEDLLNIQLVQEIYYDIATLKDAVHGSQKQGCDVVIGGGLAVHFAHQYGLIGLEINASKEGITAAIENAISVAQSNRKEKERSKRLHGIIEAVSDGIISVNRNGIVMTINQTAKKLLKIGDIIKDDIKKHLPETTFFKVMNQQTPIFDKMERIKGNLFIFNYIPVKLADEAVGCIATIKDVSHVMKTESEVRRTLAKGLVAKYRLADLIHESPAMREVVAIAKRFAPTDSTILITGETGTGKEILAQSIHNLSRRRSSPFVSLNCAALPDQLLESELFGYEDGAFTGSKKGGKPGHFEIAHNGTILLDEIAAASENVQPRLLRVLQEREVMRIGGVRLIPVDVRVIALSNKDLAEEVNAGNFREDLFFRLNILRIHIPPLRERIEDIPLMINEFIQKISQQNGLPAFNIPTIRITKLMEYSWPGNVRQVLNFTERLVLMCDTRFKPKVFESLYAELTQYSPGRRKTAGEESRISLKEKLRRRKKENEGDIILKALEESQFNKGKAAEILGISRTTLWKKIRELELR